MVEERKFSLGVFVCIFNRDFSKILLLKRNEQKRKKSGREWGNIGGMIEFGELARDACLREAREEIGLELEPEKLKLIKVREMPQFSEIFHAVQFVYATIIDENEKIEINEESDEFKWISLDDLPDKMLDKKQDILDIAEKAKKIWACGLE